MPFSDQFSSIGMLGKERVQKCFFIIMTHNHPFQMFVTDRWAWSSKDGKQHLPKESFQLPSVEWIWEGDWYIDRGIDGDNDVTNFLMLHCDVI